LGRRTAIVTATTDLLSHAEAQAVVTRDKLSEAMAALKFDTARITFEITGGNAESRKAAVMIPGPQVHAMKVVFEKYFLWKSRHGYVRLP